MYYSFPDNLKRLRKSHHLSQSKLAEKTGITQATLSDYESGNIYPRIDKVYDLAHALGVETAELVR